MKLLLILVLAIVAFHAEAKQIPNDAKKLWRELSNQYEKECLEESKTDPAYLTEMIENAHVTNERSFGCFLKCVFVKIGFMTLEEEFDINLVLADDVKEVWGDLINAYQEQCINFSGADPVLVTMIIEDAYVADDSSLGCYLMCIYNHLEFLGPDGEFDINLIFAKAPYMTDLFTQKCLNQAKNEPDHCQKSLIVGNCTITALGIP
ncbi:hypothetical protein FQR65_LT00475 [Abscondita terminalis]|nr:hypothetical protein FQR65_LT00475 [Abscondita terminalis]